MWVSVGYLLGAIVVLHIVIIAAQKFLGPLATSSAVLSEEALRARDVALYGQSGKGDVDDTVLDVDDEVHICPFACASIPAVHSAACMPNDGCRCICKKQECMFDFTATHVWAILSTVS